jgi:hypothetical protein
MEPTTVAAVAQAVSDPQAISSLNLALMLGPVLSHAVQPIAAKIPAIARPALIGVGMVAAGAFTVSAQTGVPFKAALTQGIATALVAKLYHLGVLKEGGLLSAIGTAIAAKK